MNELDEEHTKLKAKTEKLVALVKTKSSYIKHLQEDLAKIKNFATELQSFIGLKEISETTTREIGYLRNLPLSGELDELSFTVNISFGLQSVFQKITCFGSVSVSSMPSNLKLKNEVECQAPISFPKVKTIDEINPVLKRKITLPKKKEQYNITGCQILPNGHLLFVDFSCKQLLQCNNYGIFITEMITFVDNPVFVCFIKDNTVAVTLPNSYQILKIDLVSGEIISKIKRGNKCYDVASNGETICVVEKVGSKDYIAVLDLSGKQLRCIKMNGSFWSCASIFKHQLYSTNIKKNKVLCMNENGDKLWDIDEKVLKTPVGIAIDNNQFIYAACSGNNSIHIISSYGLTCRMLLSGDGIMNPADISVDPKTQTLVCNGRDGCAFMFQI